MNLDRLRQRARLLAQEVRALRLALAHPRTPWYVKAWLGLTAAYALSPIDLIPDFIPLVGQVDDLIVLPLMIGLAIRLIPPDVLDECRRQARAGVPNDKTSPLGAVLVVTVWLMGLLFLGLLVWGFYFHRRV